MRTEQARPVRLEDYAPPDWLVDTVELDVSLNPAAARVRATLALRPNPASAAPAPLVLDGDGLTRVAQARRRDVAARRLHRDARPPHDRAATRGPFRLEIETVIDPSTNTQLMGLYRSSGTYCTQCEAEGFRRITYFLDRPDVMAVYTTRIEAEKSEAPVLLSNGNLVERATCRTPRGTSRSGTTRSPSPPICSRWSAAISAASRTASSPMSGPQGRAAHLCRARQGGPLRYGRWTR